jgi:hypothetical protein
MNIKTILLIGGIGYLVLRNSGSAGTSVMRKAFASDFNPGASALQSYPAPFIAEAQRLAAAYPDIPVLWLANSGLQIKELAPFAAALSRQITRTVDQVGTAIVNMDLVKLRDALTSAARNNIMVITGKPPELAPGVIVDKENGASALDLPGNNDSAVAGCGCYES